MLSVDFREFFSTSPSPALESDPSAVLTHMLCEDGCVSVYNHLISIGAFEEMTGVARRVFDPKLLSQLTHTMNGASCDNQRGFCALNTEAYDGQDPEYKQMFTIGEFKGVHPLYGEPYPHWWPLTSLEGRIRINETYRGLHSVTCTFLAAICQHLGIPLHEFYDVNQCDDSIMRILDYPSMPEGSKVVMRANEHCDSGYLTLTWATGPGLMIQRPNGEWQSGAVPEEHLVLTVGLAFEKRLAYLATKYPSIRERLGDQLITARKHKVVAVPGHREQRFAFALFFWPHPSQEIEPELSAARHLYREMSRHMNTVARDPGR